MSNTKKAKPKRLLRLFLALTMVLGLLPAMSLTAFAYSGSGTEGDPYIVTDYEELLELMKSTPDNTTRYIKLGSDISYSASTNGTALNLSNALQSVDTAIRSVLPLGTAQPTVNTTMQLHGAATSPVTGMSALCATTRRTKRLILPAQQQPRQRRRSVLNVITSSLRHWVTPIL